VSITAKLVLANMAGAATEGLPDGISHGGTETGDPADRPPKQGYGPTESATDI
jgi:hypothetical protein